MKFALFLGCNIPARVTQYESASRAVLEKLDVGVVDMKEFNCCGYPLRNIDFKAFILLAARNLALAEQAGLDIMTLCQCCFGSLKKAHHLLEEDASLRNEVNSHLEKEGLIYKGEIEVRHLLQVLYHDVGIAAIQKEITRTYEGLPIAAHYGCHILRPSQVVQFDDPVSPTLFDQLIEITGAHTIYWPQRLECCGAPLCGINDELSMDLSKKKLDSGRQLGAEYVCVACPYCHLQFDTVQERMFAGKQRSDRLPSILYPQLLGLCMGIEGKTLGLEMNRIPLAGIKNFLSSRGCPRVLSEGQPVAQEVYRPLGGLKEEHPVVVKEAMAQKHWSNEMKVIRSQDPELADKLTRLLEKEALLHGEGNVYGERYSARQIELSFGKIVQTEAQRALILKALRKGPASVKKLATTLKLAPTEVLAHIVELRRRNRVTLHHIEERTPTYIALSLGDTG